MEVALALIGAILISLGVALWSVAAGSVVAGLLCLAGAYVLAYLKAKATKGVSR